MLGIAKIHYGVYSCEEWSIMLDLVTNLHIPYRTQKSGYDGYIQALICCTDEVLKNLEDVVSEEAVKWI